MTLPGWNSLEAATRIHAWLEITGIILLVLLLISQGIAFTYSARKEMLAGIPAADFRQSEARHRAKEAELQQKLFAAEAELERKNAVLQGPQAARHLSPEQLRALANALAAYKGQKISVTSIIGDEEGSALAEDFLTLFNAAGWDHGTHDKVDHRLINPTPVGVMLAMNEGEANAGRVMPAIETLLTVLQQLGITSRNELLVNPQVPVGEINLVVGNRPAAR